MGKSGAKILKYLFKFALFSSKGHQAYYFLSTFMTHVMHFWNPQVLENSDQKFKTMPFFLQKNGEKSTFKLLWIIFFKWRKYFVRIRPVLKGNSLFLTKVSLKSAKHLGKKYCKVRSLWDPGCVSRVLPCLGGGVASRPLFLTWTALKKGPTLLRSVIKKNPAKLKHNPV